MEQSANSNWQFRRRFTQMGADQELAANFANKHESENVLNLWQKHLAAKTDLSAVPRNKAQVYSRPFALIRGQMIFDLRASAKSAAKKFFQE
jgi:hypothetical protein